MAHTLDQAPRATVLIEFTSIHSELESLKSEVGSLKETVRILKQKVDGMAVPVTPE